MRRTTRSQAQGRRQDEPQGDQFQQPGHYQDIGMQPGGMQGLGMGLPGAPWHPPAEGFLTMGYGAGYQHQQFPQYSQPQHQPYNPYGQQQMYGQFSGVNPGVDMMSQQYQHRLFLPGTPVEEDPGATTSSGRTLRARPTPPTPTPTPTTSSGTTSTSEKRKKGGGGGPSKVAKSTVEATATHSDSSEEDGEEDENDNENVDGTLQKSKKGSGIETSLTVDDMVRNGLYYFLLQQHKKVPIKKSDLVKNAMNSQNKQFAEAMKKLEKALYEVFGMKLIRLKKAKDNNLMLCDDNGDEDTSDSTPSSTPGPSSAISKKGAGKPRASSSTMSYILVSKYPSNVCDSVMRRDPEADSKKTVLYLLLSTIFMLNRPIDEEVVWKIIQEMQLDQLVCEKKEDLRKFLKSEFVSSGYLCIEQQDKTNPVVKMKRANKDGPEENEESALLQDDSIKYSWGPRSHVEYLKYPMLKFVAARFGRDPYEFTVQYNHIRKSKEAIDREYLEDNDGDVENNEATDAKNGSALQVKQRTGGRGETFSIDGGNETETETEDQ